MAYVKQINFHDPTLKGDFDKYCRRALFHLPETLVWNQYLDVLRMLVPLPIFAKFPRRYLCSNN